MFKIAMEAKVKDRLTGFSGIVTGRVEYLTGCRRYLVQAKMKKSGTSPPEPEWLDEDRLVVSKTKNLGGPQTHEAPKK